MQVLEGTPTVLAVKQTAPLFDMGLLETNHSIVVLSATGKGGRKIRALSHALEMCCC